MSFFIQLLEAISILIPDFLTLGWVTLALFYLCSIAKRLDVTGTIDTDSALAISLGLGYLLAIAINIVGSRLTPARSTIPTSSQSRVESAGPESLPRSLKAQSVGQKG